MPINYPELGGVDQQKTFYAEGAVLPHPSGAIYKRINGNWVCIRKPEPKPS